MTKQLDFPDIRAGLATTAAGAMVAGCCQLHGVATPGLPQVGPAIADVLAALGRAGLATVAGPLSFGDAVHFLADGRPVLVPLPAGWVALTRVGSTQVTAHDPHLGPGRRPRWQFAVEWAASVPPNFGIAVGPPPGR